MKAFPQAASIASWALLLCGGLAGCAGMRAADPAAQPVSVEGRTYLVSALTAGTWIATSPSANPISTAPAVRTALLAAIEQHSGCKVTDTDYSRGGMQLDAQVDCATQLKN